MLSSVLSSERAVQMNILLGAFALILTVETKCESALTSVGWFPELHRLTCIGFDIALL